MVRPLTMKHHQQDLREVITPYDADLGRMRSAISQMQIGLRDSCCVLLGYGPLPIQESTHGRRETACFLNLRVA